MAYEAAAAAIYDLYFPPDRGPEAEFWAKMAGPGARDLLEPMVGTGEVASLLVERGFHVTGVDLSPAMLAVAEKRRRSQRLNLIHGDVCTVALPQAAFDLAYVGNGSWHLLADRSPRIEALRNIRNALRPGAKIAMELFRPIRESGWSEPRIFRPLRQPPYGFDVVKRSWTEADLFSQVLRVHEEVSVNGKLSTHDLVLQLLYPEQVIEEFIAARFRQVNLYGSRWLEPFTSESASIIVTAVA